jgi:hypothetical protein
VKKISLAFVLLNVSFVLVLFSCKKINEATDLGGNLIPGVDNVTTFDTSLNTITKNSILTSFIKNDSGHRVAYNDLVALGHINDPEFGQVHANFCFSLSAPAYNSYPFLPRKDTIHAIDSVVLFLRYSGAYGDTLSNGIQTISVSEIPFTGLTTSLNEDSVYRYNDPASEFTGGTPLGSSTFTIRNLKDSFFVAQAYDTFKVANIVRIKLNAALGTKLAQMDTTDGYKNDSLFKTILNGLAIKAVSGGNSLSYFNLADTATKLVVHYRYNANGKDTAKAIAVYRHSTNGQSNYVNVQPGGNWAASINNTAADKIYIQSSPSGSYASIVIPGLSSLSNKVIHRAEIIATKIPSASDNIFAVPPRLFLDRLHHNTDSSYLFERDLTIGSDGTIGYDVFGGTLSGNAYRFNITRYVQGIVTRSERNDTLRLWAPLATYEYSRSVGNYYSLPIPVNNRVAEGRVVLGGGTYPDPNARLRLRIVYSNL